jgi:Zn-dependent protease with chaperone function
MQLLTQSALLRALGWSLLNSLWQMAFLWLVYVLFIHIFRRASAHARHGLSVLLLGVGTIWTGISFFSAFFSADRSLTVQQLEIPLFSGTHQLAFFLAAGRQLIIEGLPYFSSLYLLTLCFLFARYGKQYIYSRQLTREGLSKASPELRVFSAQTGRRMGIKKEVKVWLSSLVDGPVTLGALKPVILIPLATLSNLTTEQVETLILHELAHIRRQDYLLHLWTAALEVLFFFNPFSRLLIRSIRKEREHRCDDLVLQFRCDPQTYVSALLALAKGIHRSPRLAVAATGSNDGLLLQRVKRILKMEQAPEPVRGKPLLFLFFTLFLGAIFLSRATLPVRRIAESHAPIIAVPPAQDPNAPANTGVRMISFVSSTPAVKSKQAATPARKLAGSRTHTVESADDEIDYYASPAPDEDSDEDAGNLAGYASTSGQAAKRDYSITAHAITFSADVKAATYVLQAPAPYVPNSSFSTQYMQDSTILPGEQYVYLQQMATHEVEMAISKMQKELQIQLKLLQQATAKDQPELKEKRMILLEQLKLQQAYLQKQHELQNKLQKIGKKKVIVVI